MAPYALLLSLSAALPKKYQWSKFEESIYCGYLETVQNTAGFLSMFNHPGNIGHGQIRIPAFSRSSFVSVEQV